MGIIIDICRQWTENQMSPDTKWNIIHIDHVMPIISFDISIEEDLYIAFIWKTCNLC